MNTIAKLNVVLISIFFFGCLFADELIPFRTGDKWGFSDSFGTIVIPCEYKNVTPFVEGFSLIEKPTGELGYLSHSGTWKQILSCKSLRPVSEGMGAFQDSKTDKWGYFSIMNGGVAITPQFDWAAQFACGLAAVKQNGKWGFIDKQGKNVVDFIYDEVMSFSDNLAAVKNNDKWGFIDLKGNIIIPLNYKGVQKFSEGLAAVSQAAGIWQFIDKTGKIAISDTYERAGVFSEGLATVFKKGAAGCVNAKGELVIPHLYATISSFSNGLASVSINGRYGYINTKGKICISLQFDDAERFNGNIARVWTGTKVISESYNKEESTRSRVIENTGGGYISITGARYWKD